MRRIGLALLILVALMIGLCATGARPASAGVNTQVYFPDFSSYAEFGGLGSPISICGSLTMDEGDWLYPTADVFIVRHESVSDGGSLTDVNPAGPNTIVATVSGHFFWEETIGFAGYAGLTDGLYDIVVDEDRNGKFETGIDYLLGEGQTAAFKIAIVAPGLPAAEVAAIKGQAQTESDAFTSANQGLRALQVISQYQGYLDPLVNIRDKGVIRTLVEVGWGKVVDKFKDKMVDSPDPLANSIKLSGAVAKHYADIANDPPDQQYTSEVLLAAQADDVSPGDDALGRSAASLASSLGVESRVSGALLSAMEKYQGASAGGDGDWCLRQAQAVQGYSRLEAERCASSATRLRTLGAALDASELDVADAAQGLRDLQTQVAREGLGYNQRTILSAMGLSSDEIAEVEASFIAADFNVDKAGLLARFENCAASEDAAASVYADFASAMQPLIDQLSISAPDEGIIPPPIATLAGPLPGTAPCSVTFDASASSDPNGGSLSFAWDLDDDGLFDDATGATVTCSYDAPQEGMVGVRVTNTAGQSRVAYAPLTVAAGAAPPAFTLVQPSSRTPDLEVGASAEFRAAADAAGVPASLSWFLDGEAAGMGVAYTYGPTAADRGLHFVTVVARGGGGTSSSRTWTVAVHDPVVLKVEPSITSAEAIAVGATEATVRVSFDLGDYSSADLSMQYRELGSATWLSSPSQAQGASGTVDAQVDGLHPGTTYEYRPVLSYADGSDHAATALFTTPVLQIAVTPVTGQSKVYGTLDPLLAYTSLPIPLGSDAFSGRLARAVGEDVGTYAITRGSLQLTGGYELKFAEGVTFAITPASTGTTLSLDGTSIYAGGSVTLTAEVTPANVGSPLTGTVAFTVNGTPYGASAVSPVAGSPSGAVQASVTVPLDKASEIPAVGASDFPVVASFTSSNANYQGSVSAASTLRVMQTPAAAGAQTFTLDADFELGALMGVEHKAVHDQLQLSTKTTAFPYIWIPNFDGTISKVNTETGAELGRYKTGPGNSDPSRTTVDLEGSCYTGNRRLGSVVKIGLPENGNWVDRNHNGVCDTSHDTNGDGYISGAEILPWGQDEAVLYELVLVAGYEGTYVPGTYSGAYDTDYMGTAPRGFAVDPGNDVWVGSFGRQMYFHIDGATGAIMQTLNLHSVTGIWHKPYGAVLDGEGILWSVGRQDNIFAPEHVLAINTNDLSDITRIDLGSAGPAGPYGAGAYGIGLDHSGHVFVTGMNANVTKIDRATRSIVWTKSIPGAQQLKGVVCTADDNVWLADALANRVFRVDNDGKLVAAIEGLRAVNDYGNGVTGVSVDTAGKVWACDVNYDAVYRINPATNCVELTKDILDSGGIYGHPGHYSYSDMTGLVARSITTKTGMWTVVHDSGSAGESWGTVSWNASEPAGTAVRVKVRSSEDKAAWSAWEDAGSGTQLTSTPGGRYLQVQVTLQIVSGATSPALYDLTVQPASQPPANNSPTVAAIAPLVSVNEGQSATNSGTWSDPDGDPVSLSASVGAVTKKADGSWSWSYAATDGPTESQQVTITADDGKGGTASALFALAVNNVAPSVTAGPAKTLVAGDTYTGSGAFSDPGADTWTAKVDYGDGSGEQTLALKTDKSFVLSHLYSTAGPYTIAVKVADKDGAEGSATVSVTVNPPANQPPKLTVTGASVNVNEGQSATNSGTWSDPDGDPVSLSASVGAVTKKADGSWSWSYAATDGPTESQQVTITADDGKGGKASARFGLVVLNVAPAVTLPATASLNEGAALGLSGSFTDPGADGPWTGSVDYGDGSGLQALVLKADKSFTLAHTYAQSGTYTVTVGVTDKDKASGSAQIKVAVANLPPSVGPISGPLDPVALTTAASFSSPFSDPGITDTHTALWSWGDGTSSAGVVTEKNGAGTVTGSHAFSLAGVYEVTLTVTDQEGAAGTALYDYLVAYDPNSGFVTGGGWINSPAGAYKVKPTLAAKASFGFVSKYFKKATNPRGNTRFIVHGAGFDFKATVYDSLTVAGPLAQYAGSGTVNGTQGFSFLVSALDGQAAGGGGVDKFRIKIWNTKSGAVVYDTQSGAADGATPTTTLGGGSIVIHG